MRVFLLALPSRRLRLKYSANVSRLPGRITYKVSRGDHASTCNRDGRANDSTMNRVSISVYQWITVRFGKYEEQGNVTTY
jgi:hypothetical protein